MSNPVEDIPLYAPGENMTETRVEEIHDFFAISGEARIMSVEAVDSTHIRVTFVRPLVNDVSLTCTSLWNIISNTVGARDIQVRGMVLEEDPVESILFTVDEMLDLADYDFELLLPREAS